MKKILKSRIMFIAFAIAMLNLAIWADSPLTSTDIAFAYDDEPIVKSASESKSVLTKPQMEFLADSKKPIDVKIALISRIGWNTNGSNNSKIYFAFLTEKRRYSGVKDFLQNGTADDLLTMAYARALSDYFRVKTALTYAEKALSKNPKSRTFNLIHGLIKAQDVMDDSSQWCEVYQITDRIRQNTELTNDIREEAVKNIYEYMDGYKDYCTENRSGDEAEQKN